MWHSWRCGSFEQRTNMIFLPLLGKSASSCWGELSWFLYACGTLRGVFYVMEIVHRYLGSWGRDAVRPPHNTLLISHSMPTRAATRIAATLLPWSGKGIKHAQCMTLTDYDIHVVKCISVESKIRRTEECYFELSVASNGQSLFLTPRRRILSRKGTQRVFNRILPVRYFLHATKLSRERITPKHKPSY